MASVQREKNTGENPAILTSLLVNNVLLSSTLSTVGLNSIHLWGRGARRGGGGLTVVRNKVFYAA